MPARAPQRALRLLLAAVVAAALAGLFAGCGDVSWEPEATPVTGDGNLTTEDRTAGDFTRISVGAPMTVTVRQGPGTEVTLEAQQNLLPLIKTEVLDGQLVVNIAPPGVVTKEPIKLTITAPAIQSLAVSGGAKGFLESMAQTLNLDAAGGASITVIGQARDLTLATSAGSHAELGELVAQDAKVTMSDGSAATVNATSSVTGTASGGSTLVLTQKPATVSVNTTGGATIQGG
jgi:hypothetical protein